MQQVVGEKEAAEGTVNVRTRDNVVHGMHPVEAVVKVLVDEKRSRSLTSVFGQQHASGGNGSEPPPQSEEGAAKKGEPALSKAES
jgi:threonyl-tRNA synthetase